MDREEATADSEQKVVQVNWVRVNNETREAPDVRCRLVAQEPGDGERLDELLAGTPSLMVIKMLLHNIAMHRYRLSTMVLDST